MAGERTAVRYRLGDRLAIKVARVDLETTRIDFSLVNKNNKLEDEPKANYDVKNIQPDIGKLRQSAVKSGTQEKGVGADKIRFGEKFGAKPEIRHGKRSDTKPTSATKPKQQNKTSKPKKVASKATKRKVKR
jgi:ribonuclease R